jgi:hypothetical protein
MPRKRNAIICISIAIVILTTLVYTRYYMTPTDHPELLQTPLSLCSPELLAEKNPILITDRLVKHEDILSTVFKYQYVYASKRETIGGRDRAKDANGMIKGVNTRARFTILFSDTEDAFVDISHPTIGGVTRVVLRSHETLVLPPMWIVGEVGRWVGGAELGGAIQLHMIQVYDIFHLLFKK